MHNPEQEWPAWPEMTHETGELDPENIKIKKSLAEEFGEESLRRSWTTVCKKLNVLTEEIKQKQAGMIRDVTYDEFFKMSDTEKEDLKEVGCFVVRGTIPEETAKEWFEDLQTYVQDNKSVITGMLTSL